MSRIKIKKDTTIVSVTPEELPNWLNQGWKTVEKKLKTTQEIELKLPENESTPEPINHPPEPDSNNIGIPEFIGEILTPEQPDDAGDTGREQEKKPTRRHNSKGFGGGD